MERQERNRKIVELRETGMGQKEIAELTSCSIPTVSLVLKDAGMQLYAQTCYGVVGKNKDRVLELVELGYSETKIANELGCKSSSVHKKLKEWGVKTKNKCTIDYGNLLKDKRDTIVTLIAEGKTQTEIGKIIGHNASSVNTFLKKEGLKANINTYNVDETFFDKIDTEAKAYILGWFYSDGCVSNAGKMRIQIQKEDEAILYVIRDLMGYSGPLYEIPPPKRFPHRKAQVCLCINRKSLADKLILLGCTPNKSLTV